METRAEYAMQPDDESNPVHFTIRHDSFDGRHARVTIFANHAHCGQLTFTLDEWAAFCAVFREFAKLGKLPITVKFDAAFELPPPLPPFKPRIILATPRPIEPTLDRMRPGLEEDAKRASKDCDQ